MARGGNFASRLRRMLVMVPWLLEQGESTVADLASHFGVSEDEVVRDLTLVMCCGVPPYGAEHLISVVLDDDGSVMAWKGPHFNRPMRLTPSEGFALLGAGRGLLAVPGADPEGPLASALDKLEAALGPAGSVAVELEAPPLLGLVREAATECRRLAVTHYSFSRDEVTERTIEPHVVFSQEGRWYVTAHDSRSGEVRHFRVDRLSEATPTGERFERAADAATGPPDSAFQAGPDTTEVTLVLPPDARWVAEAYGAEVLDERPDGGQRVRLAVSGERWLERLLLRVGPDAVVESPDDLAGVGRAAARRLLARY
jgi:proteasome accessory factor C